VSKTFLLARSPALPTIAIGEGRRNQQSDGIMRLTREILASLIHRDTVRNPSEFTKTAAGCPVHSWRGRNAAFRDAGAGMSGCSCPETICKAKRTAAVLEMHPYNSRIRCIACISCGLNRIVVCVFFSISKVYPLDMQAVKMISSC
jgi:hypothetical protein